MTVSMSTTEARAALHDLLALVEQGDDVTITRHGRPVAVVVRPDSLRSRRADLVFAEASGIRDRLDAGRVAPVAAWVTIEPDRAEALVAEIRSGRDER